MNEWEREELAREEYEADNPPCRWHRLRDCEDCAVNDTDDPDDDPDDDLDDDLDPSEDDRPEYSWTPASARWQVEHGDLTEHRTAAALAWLEAAAEERDQDHNQPEPSMEPWPVRPGTDDELYGPRARND